MLSPSPGPLCKCTSPPRFPLSLSPLPILLVSYPPPPPLLTLPPHQLGKPFNLPGPLSFGHMGSLGMSPM